jgi:hypothetical protein
VYTQAFNRRHGRVGHVLQGRFKAIMGDRGRLFGARAEKPGVTH